MTLATAGTTSFHEGTRAWPVPAEDGLLLGALRHAAERAARTGVATVASVTYPAPTCDALHLFVAARQMGCADACYWEQPIERLALVAAGVATEIVESGPASMRTAAARWRTLLDGAVVAVADGCASTDVYGPLCYGGFAFDPGSPRTALWEGFPDGLLVLPRVLVRATAGSATLTLNALVRPGDSVAAHAEALSAWLRRLAGATDVMGVDDAHPFPAAGGSAALALRDLRPAEDWQALVAATMRAIRDGDSRKVVLARGVSVETAACIEAGPVLDRLRRSYPGAYVFAVARGARWFAGATPEQLVRVADGKLHTMALAGSAPRGETEAEDDALGTALLASAKNAGEHAIVAGGIRDALAPLTAQLRVPRQPHLLKLRNVQHLQTPIEGELRAGVTVLDVVDALHPTPAVGGFPRAAALATIRSGERLDRGWYAGPLGWIDGHGDGEFAVGLRSALIERTTATLFAGCGIVADSDPATEYEESRLKLRVMLRSLSGEE